MSRDRRHSCSSEEEDGGSWKRRKVADNELIEDRLESLIKKVGEKSTASLESNLEGLASVLEADMSNYRQKIIKILCQCVVNMPQKLTIYTTLIGLLNARSYNVGGEFVEMLVRQVKESLKLSEFDKARTQVRFLSDLVNCHVIVAGSLLSMFDNFVEVCLEDNIPQVRSDWYVYAVLSSLPWVGRELYEKKESEFERLLQTIGSYIKKRQKIHHPALRVWQSDDPHPQEEYLDCLWAQVKNLENNKWYEKQILRPYVAFDSILSEALQHNLPQIIPPSHHEEAVYPLPKVIFRMFDYTDVPEGKVLPGSHAIERFLIEEQLHNIIIINQEERKDCAAALVSFESKNLPLNYMIVEVVFGQLCNLPRPPVIEIFYGTLLVELCKLQPSSMPQVLAQATEMLYERMDTMNTSCIERIANWFSYHLSNFQFRWSWDDWEQCLEIDSELPKPKFVKEVLIKCMRMSYHQRIVELVPQNFEPLIPKKPEACFKFGQEGSASRRGTMIAHQLMDKVKMKCTVDEAEECMENAISEASIDITDDISMSTLRADIFAHTVLYLGHKSISHSFAALAKFHKLFQKYSEDEEGQMAILQSTYDLWKHNHQLTAILVDKFLKTQIVECPTVANWLFSSEMAEDFTSFYVWDIMHSTIKKMNKHVEQLQKEVEETKDKLDAARNKKRDGFDDDVEDEPTEEDIETLEEKLENAQQQHKKLYLIIFNRFIILMTEHLARCETEGRDYNTPWFKWVSERLLQIFLMHHEQVYRYNTTLETLLFTSDIDMHILAVFQQFCALRA